MTAATGRVFGVKPIGGPVPIPHAFRVPLAASVAPSRNWLMGINSAGNAVAMAGDVVGLVSAGFADTDQVPGSSTAAEAQFIARQQFVAGFTNGASTDAITASDIAVAAWAADNQTVGLLSNKGGVNRSLLGLAFGLDEDTGRPVVYPGPIAWLLGRVAHVFDDYAGAEYQIADAAAGTATAERPIPRKKVHGTVTGVDLTGLAIVADNTDYVTITISKRNGSGGGAVSIASYDSRAANEGAVTAFVPADFTLSVVAGALNLLETDILTITVAKGASGKVLTGAIRVIQKVG